MRFDELLSRVSSEPIFESGLLLSGDVDPGDVQRQLSRWVRSEKLLRLRRGVYALNRPWRKIDPHPFFVANVLEPGSYVSLQSALSHHGLIPEFVPVTTSVGLVRPTRRDTPLGSYLYRHVGERYLFGFAEEELTYRQAAWVATPEKALLDLVHLEEAGDDPAYLESLRLEDLGQLDFESMAKMASGLGRPKLLRAIDYLRSLATDQTSGRII